jgi:hypothetical protein
VEDASRNRAAPAVEDLTGIRKMYRRGNGQGKKLQVPAQLVASLEAEADGGIQGGLERRHCNSAHKV